MCKIRTKGVTDPSFIQHFILFCFYKKYNIAARDRNKVKVITDRFSSGIWINFNINSFNESGASTIISEFHQWGIGNPKFKDVENVSGILKGKRDRRDEKNKIKRDRLEAKSLRLSFRTADKARHSSGLNYNDYITSKEWKVIASKCKYLAENKCEVCNSEHDLQAHHYNYKFLFSERSKDVFCLCDNCHKSYHSKLSIEDLPKDYDLKREERLIHIVSILNINNIESNA